MPPDRRTAKVLPPLAAHAARKVLRALSRPSIRPTAGAAVAFLLAGTLLLVGAGIMATELVAAATAIGIALAVGLICAVAAWWEAGQTGSSDQMPTKRTRRALRRLARAIAAPLISSDTVWVKLDQHGRIISEVPGNDIPATRGLYRAGGRILRFRCPFGFWLARRTVISNQEVWVAPSAPDRPHPGLQKLTGTAARLASRGSMDPESALVRPYEPGDPLRAISWRQSAHHGRLMSFDAERTRSVIPLVAVDTLDADDADALAAEVAAACTLIARQPGAREKIQLTDGVQLISGMGRIDRFCAALQPDTPGDPSELNQASAARARRIASSAARGEGGQPPRPIVLIASRAGGALEERLRDLNPAGLTVIVARPAPEAPAQPTRQGDGDPGRSRSRSFRRRGRKTESAPTLPSAFLSACPCALAVFGALQLAGTMVEPARWMTFGCICLPVSAFIAALVPSLPFARRRVLRVLIGAAVLALIAVSGIAWASDTLFSTDALRSIAGAGTSLITVDATEDPSWWLAAFALGIRTLYLGQWVPVTVEPISDAALIIALAPACLVCYLICTSRRARPFIACLPLGMLAARTAFMGAANEPAQVALTIACGLALRALAQPAGLNPRTAGTQTPAPKLAGRRKRIPHLPSLARAGFLVTCLVAAVFSTAVSPQATQAALNLPWHLSVQSHVLAGNSVNPLMDLKQDLERPGQTTALTYRSSLNRPLYLRLACLSDLTGGTWALDSSLLQANDPLSALLGTSGDDATDALPGSVESGDFLTTIFRDQQVSAVGSIRTVRAQITIESLSSRFAPLPIGTFRTNTPEDSTASGWHWDGSGAVYSSEGTTNYGLSYTANAAYVDPIVSTTELSGIGTSLLGSLWARLWATSDVSTTEGWWELSQKVADQIQQDRETVDERYLELPDELPEIIQTTVDELREQAAENTQRSGFSTLDDEIAVLGELLTYFADSRFAYSLDAPEGDDNYEAIASLLETGQGYCVHYASAFAVMGRALGVPTRIALGYKANANQTSDGSYIATNHDLHAWTEAYLYGIGWIPFDVTPPSSTEETAQPQADADTEDETPQEDSATQQEPDAEDPQTAEEPEAQTGDADGDATPTQQEDGLTNALSALGEALSQAAPVLAVLGAAGALLLGPAAVRSARGAWRRHLMQRAGTDPARAAQAAWSEVLAAARKRDMSWSASATEEGIATDLVRTVPGAEAEVRLICGLVCRARWSERMPKLEPEPLIRAVDAVRSALAADLPPHKTLSGRKPRRQVSSSNKPSS